MSNDAKLDISELFSPDLTGADGEALPDVVATPMPRRGLSAVMRKIPVTLTLEVGSARLLLEDLLSIEPGSVIELNTVAGEPLIIKVNGRTIGRAEVVIAGDNYGMKVVELTDLGLEAASS